jgi:hypothetical protein
MTDEGKPAGTRRAATCVLVLSSFILLAPCVAIAGPTQEEFFKSMKQAAGRAKAEPGAAGPRRTVDLKPFVLAGAAGLLLLVVIGLRKRRETAEPAPLNHPRKLLREIARKVPLQGREWRQVKAAAEQEGCQSPLTVLLCPSLLIKAGQAKETKLDPKVIARVAKKLVT